MKIGFLINPIAGMGGSVGLKGTDGGALRKAIALGAKPVAAWRARAALEDVPRGAVKFYTCSAAMGEELLRELGFDYEVVLRVGRETTPEDTRNACRAFLRERVDLVVFTGGDGTARDVASVVGGATPILGIPAGVKMSSSVFAVTPRAAGELLAMDSFEIGEGEILDIDEEEYRRGNLKMRLYGYARTPRAPYRVQGRKCIFHGVDEEESKRDIARFVLEFMDRETIYILGPGTTIKKICELIGVDKTLLGVDVLRGGRIIARDANEERLLGLLGDTPGAKAVILVSPIGSQGFLFGRGNQQISPKVIRRVGVENVLVLATPQKLSQTPRLFVDTGDRELDAEFKGKIRVIMGYQMTALREVGTA